MSAGNRTVLGGMTEKSAEEIIAQAKVVDTWQSTQHLMMSLFERQMLMALAAIYDQGKACFEFGTWEGYTTACLAKQRPHSKVYTIDLPPEATWHYENPGKAGLGHHYISSKCENVVQLVQNSLEFKPEEHSLVQGCDFVLVDGGHTYEFCRNDVENSLKMLVPGGCLVLDNIDLPGVSTVIAETDLAWIKPSYKEGKIAYAVV